MPPRKRHSPKREAILATLRATDCHPSAEWVYEQLKPRFPDLSLGTVYRNLAQFRGEGEIVSIGSVCGQERFDGNTAPHVHFICEQCGAVLDVHDSALPAISYENLESQGHRPRSHSLTFRGLCRECIETVDPARGA